MDAVAINSIEPAKLGENARREIRRSTAVWAQLHGTTRPLRADQRALVLFL